MDEQMMTGAALECEGEHYRVAVRQMPIPPVRQGEILVRVQAAAVSHMDESFLHGLSNERVEGLRTSLGQDVLTGIEFSGVALSSGERVRKGDEVIGYIHILTDRRAHAEYTVVPETALAPKPSTISHTDAAAMPSGCLTAYEALMNVAHLHHGSRVLILGAAGGVGVYAVQLARHLGCHVVAVCRPEFATLVRQMGADEVVNPGDSVLDLQSGFDLVFDTPPALSFQKAEPLLGADGVYIHTLPSQDAEGFELAKFSTRTAGYLMVLNVKGDALIQVSKLIEEGVFRPVVDSIYTLDEAQAAHERFSVHGKIGRVVIDTSGDA